MIKIKKPSVWNFRCDPPRKYKGDDYMTYRMFLEIVFLEYPFTLQKYSWIELMFGQYKIVRMLSRAFWVKLEGPGYSWVKFDKAEFKQMKFQDHVTFKIEDYTGGL